MNTTTNYLRDFQTLTETYTANPPNGLSDVQTLVDTFSYSLVKELSDTQINTEVYSYNIWTSRTLGDMQTLIESYSPYVQSMFFTQTVIPAIQPLVPIPSAQSSNSGSLVIGPFTEGSVTYPQQVVTFSGAKGGSITLNSPEFGDKDTYEAKNLNENTRGLYLILFRDPIWGSELTFEVNFAGLTETEGQGIRGFLRASTGQVITYVDIYGVGHEGFITTPEAELVSDLLGYSIKFTFMEVPPA